MHRVIWSPIWFLPNVWRQAVEARPLVGLSLLSLAVLALFSAFPGLDLGVSRLFFDPVTRTFGWSDGHPANWLRKAVWSASLLLLVLSLGAVGLALLRRVPVLGLPARAWGYVAALYVLAPGLLVEALVKTLWGRARPATVAEFGGTLQFTPLPVLSDQCLRNCSFVSGEVAGAMVLMLGLALILAWRRRGWPRLFRHATPWLALLPAFVGLQRLVSGRHFLSDVLLAGLLTLIVAVALARVFRPWPAAVDNPDDSP